MNIPIRKFLCADALVASIYHQFLQIPDQRNLPINSSISFTDVLMSGFAAIPAGTSCNGVPSAFRPLIETSLLSEKSFRMIQV